MNESPKYRGLLNAVQQTMPKPRPWEGMPEAGDDLTIAAVWLDWMLDVVTHRAAATIRLNARVQLHEPGGRRQTFAAIRKHADTVDPFEYKGGDCELCGDLSMLDDVQHYHRKADGRLVPTEILKGSY